ncbi:alpha/beta hydrolase [Coxiella endosymbiont of Amblyomma nuttalli]|uniref:alpha/beta hydrolase n=1 Tax=Coxiella endosymbiont of Amblyomma nuttalli TaxID=2749996 RepID=UPI001BADCF03|nr:carboxylesterase [Coxiella endosymbiont of Amblyomma nuttalli]QTS83581.1 Carboxylesterase 2 [Coxiella endosymbiont of Amblyomma nuttalli]
MNKSLKKIIIPPIKTAIGSVIWLHGLGADGHDFTSIIPQLNLPRNLYLRFIFPHAPLRPITINAQVRMRAWYDIYNLEDLSRREDEIGIVHTQQSINKLLEEEIAQGIPSEHIVLAGFSQGGAVALYVGLRYLKPLGGIFALSTYLPLADKLTEEASQASHHTPIFMAHGDADPVLPFIFGYQAFQRLKQLNYLIEWHSYPMGHQISIEEIRTIGKWLTSRFS